MGIVLRLGPRSENTVELLRFQPTIRGGEGDNDGERYINFSEDS